MKNGHANGDDDPRNDPKISRIEDARRRRQRGEGAKKAQAKGSAGGAKVERGGVKEWIVGAVIVAMAVGLIGSLAAPVVRWAMGS